MKTIQQYRNQLEQLKGKKQQIKDNIRNYKHEIHKLKKELITTEKAQIILQKVAKDTQSKIVFHISNIVTLALNSIYDENYTFNIEFVEKRNKTECEITFIKNGQKEDPMNASGGGVVDVASFALRVSLWSLSKKRNTIILDEPVRYLSKDKHEKFGEMLKLLSKKLNLQFIIVSHDRSIIDCADKVYKVKQVNGVSNVEVLS